MKMIHAKDMKNFKGEKKGGRKSPAKYHAGKSKVLLKPDLA